MVVDTSKQNCLAIDRDVPIEELDLSKADPVLKFLVYVGGGESYLKVIQVGCLGCPFLGIRTI
jgi:hypothetical protein